MELAGGAEETGTKYKVGWMFKLGTFRVLHTGIFSLSDETSGIF